MELLFFAFDNPLFEMARPSLARSRRGSSGIFVKQLPDVLVASVPNPTRERGIF